MQRRNYLYLNTIFLLSLFSFPNKILSIESITQVGDRAPYFKLRGSSLKTKDTKEWSLDNFKGSWLIAYFYPKDFTSGCTIEARGFNSIIDDLADMNAKVIGISADNISEHNSFCSEEKLKFPLLSDNTGEISKLYQSWNDPYSARNTFLINPDGIVKYKWVGVRPTKHASEVLLKLSALINES